MGMLRRVGLFLATNFAVLILLGIVMSILQGVFGIRMDQNGSLLVFAAIFGFGGSLISLAMSKWMAKRATGAQVIEQPRNQTERWLLEVVGRQAAELGLTRCPRWRLR